MNLIMTGTRDMSSESMIVGRRFVITPRMTFGQLLINFRNGATSVR